MLIRWRNIFIVVFFIVAVAGFAVALVGCDQLPTSLPVEAFQNSQQDLTNYRLQSPGFKRIIIGSGISGSSLVIMVVIGLCCKNYEATVLPS